MENRINSSQPLFQINIIISVPSILLKFSDQKTGSRRVVGWHKKSEKYFGFILAAKPRLRWVPEVYVVKIYFCMKRKFLKKEFWLEIMLTDLPMT